MKLALVAMDKFRSTALASELTTAIAHRPGRRNVHIDAVAMSDGGEGFREVFRGETTWLSLPDPWGRAQDVALTLLVTPDARLAVVEVAEIIGQLTLSHPTPAQALAASSAGVGEAILAATSVGVDRVIVGCGGSATSDGGEGCYDVLRASGGLPVAVTAATDVDANFLGALRFAEQKGVRASDLKLVEGRLRALATRYESECGRDVLSTERAGAAGGLAGALYALGANLVSGFDEVARINGLAARVAAASMVITGEGRLDGGSLEGKVVAGVCALTNSSQRVLVICGSAEENATRALLERYPWVEVVELVTRFGTRRAFEDTLACVASVAAQFLGDGAA